MSNVFYAHFPTDNICRPTDDFHGTWYHLEIKNENFNCVRSILLFCKVLRFERTRCFCFLHLNFMITRSFVLMQWQACRSSGFTDISIRDSAWHTDCSRTSSAISDGTRLISRVSLLVYWALFKLLHSNCYILTELYTQVEGHYNVLKSTG